MKKKGFVSFIVAMVGVGVVVSLLKFNFSTASYDHYILGNLIALLFVPMLTILFVFRENVDGFGFSFDVPKRSWLFVGVVFAGLFVLMLAASQWDAYQRYYPIFRRFQEFGRLFDNRHYPEQNPFVAAPLMMLYAEVSYGLYMFCWEFFFRGYLLFGLFRSIGWPAIIVQAVAFGLLHLGKPLTEQLASYGAGIILGLIALNARSFLPCFVLHWAASISFDLLIVSARPH